MCHDLKLISAVFILVSTMSNDAFAVSTFSIPSINALDTSLLQFEALKSSYEVMCVRLSDIHIDHQMVPGQRDLNHAHVARLVQEAWGNGEFLHRSGNLIEVISQDHPVPLGVEIGGLPVGQASSDTKYTLISGNYRVAALKVLVEHMLKQELKQQPTEEQIYAHPQAWWPAKIYGNGQPFFLHVTLNTNNNNNNLFVQTRLIPIQVTLWILGSQGQSVSRSPKRHHTI